MSTENNTITEDNAYSIASYILDNLFKIHNQANGNGYTVQVGDKRKKVSTTDNLVDLLYEKQSSIVGDEKYQELVKYFMFRSNEERKPFDEIWKKYMRLMIQAHIQKKSEKRDDIVRITLPSAYGAKFSPCKYLPRKTMNEKDVELLKGLCICDKNSNLYFELHGNYTLLGTPTELQMRNSPSAIKAASLITKSNAERKGIKDWDLWDDTFRVCDKLTDEFMDIRREIENAIKEGVTLDIPVKAYWMDNEITIREFLQLPDGPTPTDVMDKLHSAFSKVAINKLLSSLMINKDLGNLFIEMDEEWFKRYAFRPGEKSGKKCSLQDYISAAMSELPSLSSKIPHLKEEPKVISDLPGVMCRFNMYSNWMEDLPTGQKDRKDCKCLYTFLKPYSREERLAIMAYAYTVWHPSTNDPINMALKTGGGTLKTSTYAQNIIDILNFMYRPEGSIVHKMIGDTWVKDPARLENSSGDGVSTAALVFNDECTETSINKFKDMSGGSSDSGVFYQKRVMRENPTELKIYCKFLFLTNVDFQIQDTDGAFDRRLFVIDRMDVKKLELPYDRSSYNNERKRELKVFYEYAKKCYEEVVEKYGSLSSMVVSCKDINKNLKQAYNEDAKITTYYQLWESIDQKLIGPEANDIEIKKFDDGSVGISNSEIESELSKLCEVNGVNIAGMRKWIKNTDSCTGQNINRYRMRFNKSGLIWGYRIFPLKEDSIPTPDVDFTVSDIDSRIII